MIRAGPKFLAGFIHAPDIRALEYENINISNIDDDDDDDDYNDS